RRIRAEPQKTKRTGDQSDKLHERNVPESISKALLLCVTKSRGFVNHHTKGIGACPASICIQNRKCETRSLLLCETYISALASSPWHIFATQCESLSFRREGLCDARTHHVPLSGTEMPKTDADEAGLKAALR